ncbi:MAG: carboxypeptidase regulatory-like domain-containing protein [Nannocystaceae bacterium]|nr:carboxypeptidase regulatory-like domain-containing protein [Nannocystaceae bacterium]
MLAVVAFAVFRAEDPVSAAAPQSTAAPVLDDELLAHLRQRREAIRAETTQPVSCAFHGTVQNRDGQAIAGAVLALAKDSAQTNVLDPEATTSDAEGLWQSDPLDEGEYVISVTAPGHLASTAVHTCDGTGGPALDLVLEPGGTRLHGTVEDIGGGPIAGVTVWLVPTMGNTGAAIATITADDGTYDVSLHPDRYTLLAVHPVYVLEGRQTVVSGRAAREDFVLVPGGAIEGVVTEVSTGDPVQGARVTTVWSLQDMTRGPSPFASVFAAMFPAVTDASGKYRLTGLPPGAVRVTARTKTLVNQDPAVAKLAIAETESDVAIEVSEAFSVSGFVVERGNATEGIAGVNVVVIANNGLRAPNFATTDDAGYYEIAGIVSGEYQLLVAGEGAAALIADNSIVITDHDVKDVLVRAERGVSVSGRITPPGRASIRLQPASHETDPAGLLAFAVASLAPVEIDASGVFRISSVADGDYILVASTIDGEGRVPVTVDGSGVTDVAVDIEPLARIEGRVTDSTGRALVGALVVAVAGPTIGFPTHARTDHDGGFEIVGLPAATYKIAVFDGVGQRPWADVAPSKMFEARALDVDDGDSAELDLSVQSEAKQLSGVVVDPSGEPIQDAWVRVRARGSQPAPAGYGPQPTLTDSAGEFTIDALFGADFEVRATGHRGKLEAVPVDATAETPVVLTLAAISTVVASVTENGLPVQDFKLYVSGGPTTVITSFVEKKNGAFVLPNLMSGTYKIEVSSETGYAREQVTVGPDPETSVELQLQSTASIHGKVLGEDGFALGGAKLLMVGVRLSTHELLGPAGLPVSDDGTFEVHGLAAGRGRILILGPGESPDFVGSLSFRLKSGDDLDLGTMQQGKRRSRASAPFIDSSEELGVRFFVGPTPPTEAQLLALDEAEAPRDLLETRGAQLWIATMTSDGPAYRAGIRTGDSVHAVGQMQVGDEHRTPSDAMISLSERWRSTGRSVLWVVERDGERLELPLIVPE